MNNSRKSAGNQLHICSLVLLALYIFFSYTAQETLLPPFLHSMVMYLFIAWSFFVLICNKKFTVSYYTIWYLILMALAAVSFLWATNVVVSALYTMMTSLIITFCVIQALKSTRDIDFIMVTFVVSAVIMGIMIIATGQLNADERLGESITGNANSFSALLMVAAILAVWLFTYRAKKWMKLLPFSSLLFILYLMLMSGGRKTIIAVLVSWIVLAILKDIHRLPKTLFNLLKIAAIFIVLYLVVMKIPFFYNLVGQRFEGLFDLLSGKGSDVSGDETRKILVEIGLKKWQESPLLGFGLDTFKYYNRTVTGHFYYAHNNYVELLFDFGLVGTILYYGFFVFLAYKIKKTWHTLSPYKALGVALLVMMLIYDIGGISYYTVLMQIILSMVFVFAMMSSTAKESK